MLEKWKYVIGYEGLYEVSNLGRVRSLCFKGNVRKEPLIMNGSELKDGYLIVNLSKDRKVKSLLIHRLVCESFILGRKMKDGEVCDHINTIRDDNRVENLRVCSRKENCNNPLSRKNYSLAKIGKTYAAKFLTLKGVKDGSVYHFKSSADASRFFDCKTKIANYIFNARRTGKRTIKINKEEFYFSQSE